MSEIGSMNTDNRIYVHVVHSVGGKVGVDGVDSDSGTYVREV